MNTRRRKKVPVLVLLTVLMTVMPAAQTHVLNGVVTDGESRQPLPGATIRILGGMLGTVANTKGEFRFSLPAGPYRVAASFLGYQSDTAEIDLSADARSMFLLFPNPVQMAAVTVTDEDPAVEIVRRAIAKKAQWMERLRTFEGKAFHRVTIRNDSSIAAIIESYSTLYWARGDSLREVVTQQKQTGNLPKMLGGARVGDVVNFNDDRIALGGFTFTGPTALEALDLYDFRLLSTRSMDGFDVYTIRITPRSVLRPLFTGTISIAERSYAVMEVDVTPNEAFVQPFIDLRSSRYRESFRLYGNGIWLPSHYHFGATFVLSLAGLRIPAFGIESDLVMYDYAVNPAFADTIARMNRMTVDSSAVSVDSVFWNEHDVLPLTAEQDSAYRTLDSTQSLEKKFAPTGATMKVLDLFGSATGFADVWFNRVEGFHLGVSRTFREVLPDADLRAGAGYGFSDHRWKWSAGASYSFGPATGSSGSFGITNVRLARKTIHPLSGCVRQERILPEAARAGTAAQQCVGVAGEGGCA